MLSKPLLSLLAALALAVALPACGEDEPATTGTTQEQTTTEGTTTPEASSQDVQAAIDACRQSVQDAPQLSADLKAELEGICEEGDTTDPQQVRANAGKVCERIVEEQVPEGPVRDQALETCKTATQ